MLRTTLPGLCLDCHKDKRGGQHSRAVYTGLCSRCHDPHASSAEKLLVPSAKADCNSCHPEKNAGEFIHSAIQEYDCGDCHDPHARPPGETLGCAECHDDLLAGANIHPPLEDGCWDCHGTHTGPLADQLLTPLPELCIECHDDKEHGLHGRITLGTDCSECHDPHSSDRRSMLNHQAATAPCASCHVSAISRPKRHTPVEKGRCERCHNPHLEDPVPIRSCTECHSTLMDGKYIHDPAEEGCDNCHATHSGDRDNQLLQDMPGLCLECHDGKEEGRHGKVKLDDDCVRCHNPHSSSQPRMLTMVQEADGCTVCHTATTRRPQLHTPVSEYDCDECHNPHNDPPEETSPCSDCHDDLLAGAVVHEPAEDDCTNCHDTHSGVREYMLLTEHPELCLDCHDDKEEGMHGRSRMSTSCISCHDPHSAPRRGLVESMEGRRCQSCHQDKDGFKYRHSALDSYDCADCHNPHTDPPEMPPLSCQQCHDGLRDQSPLHSAEVQTRCQECHDPHGSENRNMMVDKGALIMSECLTCHREIARKLEHALLIHDPVDGNDCGECHTSHTGKRPYTVEKFDSEMYVPYDQGAYTLCFGCHEYSLVQSKFTDTDTGFRDGSQNLHYLHVVRDGEKGFSCWVCHDMHGTRQPHLLNRENPYNPSYRLKVNFRDLENGGECRTNCHTTREYLR
jgi:predicted CXXCH cytochrome family protein